MCLKNNYVKLILQPIPYYKFNIYMPTEYCEN